MPLTAEQIQIAGLAGYASAVPLKNLRCCHAEYNVDEIDDYEALYEGGQLFQDRINRFLVKRTNEGGGAPAYAQRDPSKEIKDATAESLLGSSGSVCGDQYENRKKYAWYIPRVGGMVDFVRGAIISSTPVITAVIPTNAAVKVVTDVWASVKSFFGVTAAADPRIAFYSNLNDDCDGTGQSLVSKKSEVARQLLVQKRAYIGVCFPEIAPDAAANMADAKKTKYFDAKLCFFGAREMNNWELDKFGRLKWIRRYLKTKERRLPTDPPLINRETWTYMTPAGLYTYALEYPDDKPPKEDDPVPLVAVVEHDLGEMPVKQVPIGIHMMKRLKACVVKHFNRTSSITWALNLTAFALLVICSQDDLSAGFNPESLALQLRTTGSTADWRALNAQSFDPLFKDKAEIEDEMYECMMAMVLKAAAMASNGRQSEGAKQKDFDAFETFLEIFSEPLKATLTWAVRLIQRMRGDTDLAVAVQGLDNFDIDSMSQILDNAGKYLALMGVPPTAKKAVLIRATKAMLKNSSPEIVQKAIEEIVNMADDELAAPEPIEPAAQPMAKAA